MSSEAPNPAFQSRRAKQNEVEVVKVEVEVEVEATVRDTILVISQTKGIGEMVGRAIGLDNKVNVRIDTRPMTQIARDEALDFSDCGIVVFEAHPGDDLEMKALRVLRAKDAPDTRFLAMTIDPVTLAYAKQLMEAGVDEVLPLTSVRPDLRHAVEIEGPVAVAARQGGELRNGIIVALAKTRGGIGATSLALNLGHALSEAPKGKKAGERRRVAVIDLDFQNGNLGALVDIEDNGAFLDLLKGGRAPDGTFVDDALVSYKDRFDILAAPIEFAPLDSMTPEVMALLLGELRMAYDYVILDLPRALVKWIEPVLARTDQMLIVTDTSVASIRQARRLVDFFTEDHAGLPIDLVVSKEKKPFSLPESLKEAVRFLGRPLEHWVPCDDKKAKKASDLGQPIVEASRRTAIAKPLAKICAQLNDIHAKSSRREA